MSFAIHVHYLTGYCCAAEAGTGRVEWPPHPARLFMALVSACYESGGEVAELAALRWLESLDPPTVFAGDHDPRRGVQVFVPTNDRTSPKDADKVADGKVFENLRALPQHRDRKERSFARAWLHDERTAFAWDDPVEHREALDRLCGKVGRLGHASSLVHVWLGEPPEADGRTTYTPTGGRLKLRTTNGGLLDDLDARFNREPIDRHFALDAAVAAAEGKAKKAAAKQRFQAEMGKPWKQSVAPPTRQRPEVQRSIGYGVAGESGDVPGTVFEPTFEVLTLRPAETTYRRLPAAQGPRACEVLRRAILKQLGPKAPDVLTGHDADNRPLDRPHMAIFPLPDVGHDHAGGHLLGLGVALPRDGVTPRIRADLINAIDAVPVLTLGKLGTWHLAAVDAQDRRHGLQLGTWTRASTCWATVTPIALDRHPKVKEATEQQSELGRLIREACGQVGVDNVKAVVPFPVSPFLGAPTGYAFPRLPRKDGSERRQTHAMIWLKEARQGPLLVGAGRYRGWGLCRPYKEGGAT